MTEACAMQPLTPIPQVPSSATSIPWYSSYGPLSDGRIKPDVIAPGTELLAAAGYDRPAGEHMDLAGLALQSCTVRGLVRLRSGLTPAPFRLKTIQHPTVVTTALECVVAFHNVQLTSVLTTCSRAGTACFADAVTLSGTSMATPTVGMLARQCQSVFQCANTHAAPPRSASMPGPTFLPMGQRAWRRGRACAHSHAHLSPLA